MAVAAALSPKMAVGAYLLNALDVIEFGVDVETKPSTSFDSGGFTEQVAALRTLIVAADGFTDYGTGGNAEAVRAAFAATQTVTVTPEGDTATNVAVMTQSLPASQRMIAGRIGELPRPALAFRPVGQRIVEGQVSIPTTTITSTTNGSACQLGLLGSGESLYAACHLVTLTGGTAPTVTFKVQSDDNSGFTSATDRLTVGTALSAVGAQWNSVAGAVATDTYWRVVATITGSPSAVSVLCSIGIL